MSFCSQSRIFFFLPSFPFFLLQLYIFISIILLNTTPPTSPYSLFSPNVCSIVMISRESSSTLAKLLLPVLLASTASAIVPEHDTVIRNANDIFNAVNAAGRQWGSSVNHIGFGVYPAYIPAGTMLYRGGPETTAPTTPEWLAFDIHHAQHFALRNVYRSNKKTDTDSKPMASKDEENPDDTHTLETGNVDKHAAQKVLTNKHNNHSQPKSENRAYLQTYQAAEDLKVLYLDGMSAAHPDGPHDTWNMLRDNETTTSPPEDDPMRADPPHAMCEIVNAMGYQAIVRMEMGFEVIYCDFNDGGLDLISQVREKPLKKRLSNKFDATRMPWARSAVSHYDGLGSKLFIAFSSMFSALFYPVSMTDASGQYRISAMPLQERRELRAGALQALQNPTKYQRVNWHWQEATTAIVARFAGTIAALASGKLTTEFIAAEVEGVAAAYCNYEADVNVADETEAANKTFNSVDMCSRELLRPVTMYRNRWTEQDKLLHTAISVVTEDICSTYIASYGELLAAAEQEDLRADDRTSRTMPEATRWVVKKMRGLTERLAWPEWEKLQPCEDHEVAFTPMFPLGNKNKGLKPACRSSEDLRDMDMDFVG